MAYFNARVSGAVVFGVSDAGIVHGLRLGKEALKRKWMDECEQALIARASQALSQELDPALATIVWQSQKVTGHPDGDNFYIVSVHLKYKAAPESVAADYLIRLDERDGWSWPIKVCREGGCLFFFPFLEGVFFFLFFLDVAPLAIARHCLKRPSLVH